jgi:hypothetical protein
MIFECTRGYALVRSILTEAGVYGHMTDDFAPKPDDFQVNTHEAIRYVIVWEGGAKYAPVVGRCLGMFCFFPENEICWQAHVALLRGLRPAQTRQIGREVMAWLWGNTPCLRLVASVPKCNRAAVRYGLDPGGMNLLPFGVNEKSFLKHGKLWDQVLMGRSKPGE